MGGATSNLAKSIASPVKWLFSWNKSGDSEGISVTDEDSLIQRFGATPFVHKRRGSMYMDEDGDLAHEFYEQVLVKRKGKTGHRFRMRKKVHHLTPQGDVPVSPPRLHTDFPAVLCQIASAK